MESDAARAVGLDGFGQVQGREGDLFVPGAIGVVVGTRIQDSVGDRILGDFFAVSITKYENGAG